MTLNTAWELARAWYHDRLDPDWSRPTLGEAEQLFARLGMTESFWSLNRR